MSMSPETVLSVIVVNRNTSDLLVRCLDHIFRSEIDGEFEVIVVDNGSGDDSVERAARHHPRTTIIEAGRNLGFAAANNRAFEETHGEFLLLVNTDAMLRPDCGGKLLNLMRTSPRAGMAGPQLLNEDGSPQTSYEAVPTLATETLNRSLLKRLFPARYPSKFKNLSEPTPVEALIGAVMMIRRDAWIELRGFDEDYFFFLEETDLAVRMAAAGWGVIHEPNASAVHLQGATANTVKTGARIEFYRSRYLFFLKHYGARSMNVLKGALTANLAINAAFLGMLNAATRGRSRSVSEKYLVRRALWEWHRAGCPAGPGLPRD
ncbi:MAG: glycosyltransferase family 2 protein [Desulfomonilaceae bacterium]|nr:glycosyltransferase family 2 protein [Desulfomonilaceae bacterium]